MPFILAGVTAVGAGFLIQDRYLFPLLAVFLMTSIGGTALSMRRHNRKLPLIVSIAGAGLTFGGLFLHPAVAYAGIATLLLVSILDFRARRTALCELPRPGMTSQDSCN